MLRFFVLCVALFFLQACSYRLGEVQEWVALEHQKSSFFDKTAKVMIVIPDPFLYDLQHMLDPFDRRRLKLSGDVHTMFSVPKEAFTIETLVFVGMLKNKNSVSAILKTKNGFLFVASVGDVIGSSKAKVERVTDQYLEYSEIINDGIGNMLENRSHIFVKKSDFYKDVK